MLFTFRSDASGDLLLLGDAAKKLLAIIGKDPEDTKGIVTVPQLPNAIALLRAAIEEDRARQAERDKQREEDAEESEADREAGRTGMAAPVSLAQRAWPLLEMLEAAQRAASCLSHPPFLQNAFANSSSSLIQSKITGNIIFVLLPPLSYREFFAAYVIAAVLRGLLVGLGVFVVTVWFVAPGFHNIGWILAFALLGSAILGTMGLIGGIWADKFDQIAAFQNFVVMPLNFLSGVFYSVKSLPGIWQTVSQLNPFFYMVDGFRRGFLGVSDVDPWLSLVVVGGSLGLMAALALFLLSRGYKLRH